MNSEYLGQFSTDDGLVYEVSETKKLLKFRSLDLFQPDRFERGYETKCNADIKLLKDGTLLINGLCAKKI